MDIQLLRCMHCGIKYEYYASGFDMRCDHSTRDWCSTCATTANKLLAEAIPANQYVPKFIETEEVTIEQLREERKKTYTGLCSIVEIDAGYLKWPYNNQKYYTKYELHKCLLKDPEPEDPTVYKKMCLNTNTNTIEGEW